MDQLPHVGAPRVSQVLIGSARFRGDTLEEYDHIVADLAGCRKDVGDVQEGYAVSSGQAQRVIQRRRPAARCGKR